MHAQMQSITRRIEVRVILVVRCVFTVEWCANESHIRNDSATTRRSEEHEVAMDTIAVFADTVCYGAHALLR